MPRPADGRLAGALTRPLVGAIEGVVNLVYIFLGYLLLAGPVLAFARELLPRTAAQLLAGGVTVLVVVLCVSVLVGIGRLSGPVVAAGLGVMVLGAVAMLPSGDWGLPPGAEIVWSFQLVVALAGVIALVAARRPFGQICARFAGTVLFSLVVVARPTATAGELAASRRQLILIVGTVGDLLLLLVADLVIRPPVVAAVGALVGPIAAAIGVGGVLGLIWLVLGIRLKALGGWSGLLLAFLLGAPLLLSLPFLDPRILGSTWPATLAVWGVAIAASLLLVAARRPLQAAGESALGPVLDRGLLGGQPAVGEEAGERRVAALGGVVGALLDVALLLAGYWLLGLPLIDALERSTGQRWLGSAAVGALLVVVGATLWGRAQAARKTIGETTGDAWARRATVLLALVMGLTIVIVGCFAAVPTVLAAPNLERFGAFAPVDHVVVDWQFWQPSTPSTAEATYNVAFSCSNGDALGEFREVMRPLSAGAMPAGPIRLAETAVDPNGTPCASWQEMYFGLRRAAGLSPQPSHSWNWVDLRIVLAADGSADVVERDWVTFTSGVHDRLEWSVPGELQGMVGALDLGDGGVAIPLNPSGIRPLEYAETGVADGRTTIVWHFAPVNSPNERSLTIKYHLAHAALLGADRTQFAQTVIVPRTGPVWRTTVAIVFPPGVNLKGLQLGSSDASGRRVVIDNQTAWFESKDVPSDGSLTVSAGYAGGAAQSANSSNPSSTQIGSTEPAPATTAVAGVAIARTAPPVGSTETSNGGPTPSDTPTTDPGASTTSSQPPGCTGTATPCATNGVVVVPTDTGTAALAGTPTTTSTVNSTGTATSTQTPTVSLTGTVTPTPTDTLTGTVTPTPTVSLTGTVTPTPTVNLTETVTPTPTVNLTETVTPTPTVNLTGTVTPTPTVDLTGTATPTIASTVTSTPTTMPTATPTPTIGLAATSTPTTMPTATPTSTTVLAATSTKTSTPSPTVVSTATFTPSATATPCAPFANGVLTEVTAAKSKGSLTVKLTWQSTGGCAPYNGNIVGHYLGGPAPIPTRNIGITGANGSTNDSLPQDCASTQYSMTLTDAVGHVVSASAQGPPCP